MHDGIGRIYPSDHLRVYPRSAAWVAGFIDRPNSKFGRVTMTTLDELHERLRVAAAILDTAAGDIRNVGLAPTKDNVRHIGRALASIFDVMLAVYAVRPDLTPAALEPERGSEANKRLTVALEFYPVNMNHSERVAKFIVEAASRGLEMRYQSDQSRGECDFELFDSRTARGAVEVTSSVDFALQRAAKAPRG